MQIAEIDFCTVDDADALHAIETSCFDHPWSRAIIEYDLDNQGLTTYLKATLKDTVCGYAVISRDEDCAHLLNIAVLPAYQRQGIASQLLLALEVLADEWGARRMKLEVRSTNAVARELYSRIGFVYHTRRKAYYSTGEDALVLVAKLPLKIIDRVEV